MTKFSSMRWPSPPKQVGLQRLLMSRFERILTSVNPPEAQKKKIDWVNEQYLIYIKTERDVLAPAGREAIPDQVLSRKMLEVLKPCCLLQAGSSVTSVWNWIVQVKGTWNDGERREAQRVATLIK
jgi:hypothetical protein